MAHPDRSVYDPPFEDDLMFDAVDEHDTTRGKPLLILLGAIVVLAFGGVVWVAYNQGANHAISGAPPILAQEPGPTKVAPTTQAVAENPAQGPIFEQMENGAAAAEGPGNLAAPAEEPQMMDTAPATPPEMMAQSTSPGAVNPNVEGSVDATVSAEPAPDMTVADVNRPQSLTPAKPSVAPPAMTAAPAPAPVGTPEQGITPSSVDPVALPEPAPPAFTGLATDVPPQDDTATRLAAKKAEAAKAEAKRKADARKAQEAERLAQKNREAELAKPTTTAPSGAAVPVPALGNANDPLDEAFSPSISKPRSTSTPALTAPTNEGELGPSIPATPSSSIAPLGGRPNPTEAANTEAASGARAEALGRTEGAEPSAQGGPLTAEPPSTTGAAKGSHVVQIGSYTSMKDAASSWQQVRGAHATVLTGTEPEIRKVNLGAKGIRYRLRATGYAGRAEATQACQKLKASGQDCVVTPR